MGDDFYVGEMTIVATRSSDAPQRARSTPASPEEGARLIAAFIKISDPAIREAIIDWVSEQAKYG